MSYNIDTKLLYEVFIIVLETRLNALEVYNEFAEEDNLEIFSGTEADLEQAMKEHMHVNRCSYCGFWTLDEIETSCPACLGEK